MEAKESTTSSRSRTGIRALVTTSAIAAVVLPASAGAAPITPEVVKPQVVKPQVVTPAPQPAPSPDSAPRSTPAAAPSPAPAPSPSPSDSPAYGPGGDVSSNDAPPAENEVPGAHVPGSPSAPPYPEGLPAHWDSACELSCLGEWLEWYTDRHITVYNEAASGSAQDLLNAKLLADEVKAIEDAITAMGGNPDTDYSPSGEQMPTSDRPNSGGSPAPPEVFPIPDAITGVGPIIGSLSSIIFGTWDGTKALESISGVGLAEAIGKALLGGSSACSGGPTAQDKPNYCPK